MTDLFAEQWFTAGPLKLVGIACHNMIRIVIQRRSHWGTATRRMLLISFVSM